MGGLVLMGPDESYRQFAKISKSMIESMPIAA